MFIFSVFFLSLFSWYRHHSTVPPLPPPFCFGGFLSQKINSSGGILYEVTERHSDPRENETGWVGWGRGGVGEAVKSGGVGRED